MATYSDHSGQGHSSGALGMDVEEPGGPELVCALSPEQVL